MARQATDAAHEATNIATLRSIPFISAYSAQYSEHDSLTLDQALKLADADFTVVERKVATLSPKGYREKAIATHKATVRDDTNEVLAVVGANYQVVQTRDAIEPIVDALLGTGETGLNSAWSLRGGRAVGVTLQVPEFNFTVNGGDAVDMFLMIRTSHDGNSSVMGDIAPLRLKCLNMIRMFERESIGTFRIKHTSGATVKLGDARNLLERVGIAAKQFEKTANVLLDKKLVESQVQEILDRAFPVNPDISDAQRERTINFAVFRNWQESDTIADVRETAWGLVNATNEYFEHLAPVRTRTYDVQSARAISILQGTAAQATDRVARLVRAA